MNKKNKEFIDRFLEVLGKEGCEETTGTLCYHFGLENIDKEESYVSGIMMSAYRAMASLYYVYDENQIHSVSEYGSNPNKIKKLKALHRSLSKSLELLSDKDIQQYFRLTSEEHEIVPQSQIHYYKNLHDRIYIFYHEIGATLKNASRPKGRPALKDFDKYVFEVACLYEELSGHTFTVDRYKESGKGHMPVTKGMDFIWIAMDWLHAEARFVRGINKKFSSSNIANACDKARTKIRMTNQSALQ